MQRFHFISKLVLSAWIVLLTFSCNKEKDFKTPGKEVLPTSTIDPNTPILQDWLMVSSAYTNIKNLTVGGGKLYFEGNNFGEYFIVEVDVSNNLEEKYSSPSTTSTYNNADFIHFNNSIYLSSLSSPYFSKLNLASEVYTSFNVYGVVRDLQPFQGNLILGGTFPAQGFTSSQRVDCMTPSEITTGAFSSGADPFNGIFTDEQELYGYNYDVVKKWNGTTWTTIASGLNVGINSAVKRNDTIFVAGTNIAWDNEYHTIRYVKNGTGDYLLGPNSTTVSQGGFLKIAILNGEIYAFGNGLSWNGVYSNVFRLVGTDWKHDAVINVPVYDLEYFNGHLYAATANGLFMH